MKYYNEYMGGAVASWLVRSSRIYKSKKTGDCCVLKFLRRRVHGALIDLFFSFVFFIIEKAA